MRRGADVSTSNGTAQPLCVNLRLHIRAVREIGLKINIVRRVIQFCAPDVSTLDVDQSDKTVDDGLACI